MEYDGEDPKEDSILIEASAHLIEVLEDAAVELSVLEMEVNPFILGMDRDRAKRLRRYFWRVSDALRHSVGVIRDGVQLSSDGTRVWPEEPSPAVTNEGEVTDGQGARPEMAASGSRSGSGAGWLAREESAGQDRATRAYGPRESLPAVGAQTLGRRETETEKLQREKRREQKQEERRLAQLRKAKPRYPRRKR